MNIDDLLQNSLEKVAENFKDYYNYCQCKKDIHQYSEYSGFALHNVSELTEEEHKNGAIFINKCLICGKEMPESRKGQKNYKSYKDYIEKLEEELEFKKTIFNKLK